MGTGPGRLFLVRGYSERSAARDHDSQLPRRPKPFAAAQGEHADGCIYAGHQSCIDSSQVAWDLRVTVGRPLPPSPPPRLRGGGNLFFMPPSGGPVYDALSERLVYDAFSERRVYDAFSERRVYDAFSVRRVYDAFSVRRVYHAPYGRRVYGMPSGWRPYHMPSGRGCCDSPFRRHGYGCHNVFDACFSSVRGCLSGHFAEGRYNYAARGGRGM